jgi:hypothetical protein
MPMMGGAQLVATARTVAIESLAQLADMITEVKAAAAEVGRTDSLDFLSSYQGVSAATPDAEADRHREAFGEIEKAGVTHVIISVQSRRPEQTLECIEAFGAAYLSDPPAKPGSLA